MATLEINGVECTIWVGADGSQGGITESYPLDSTPEAHVHFKCDWFDRQVLIQGLLGTVTYENGMVSRTPPFAYPLLSDLASNGSGPPQIQLQNRWICTGIGTVSGIKWRTDNDDGENTGMPGWGYYDSAVFEAIFTVPLWQVDQFPAGTQGIDLSNYPYVVTKTRTSGEVFAPPTGAVIYQGGKFAGKALSDVNASLIRTRTEISMTLVRFPIVPTNLINALIGSVNQARLQIGTFTFPMGSILFTGVNNEPRADPCSFGIIQDVELVFLANGPASAFQAGGGGSSNLDWNYFVDPSGKWVPCGFNTDPPTPIFSYEDFTQFFNNNIA